VKTFDGLEGYEWEIVFIDNHSTDRTFEILEKIGARAAFQLHTAGRRGG
jgi:glycosyltransferase involved in cell wall biosynthesis